MVKILLVGCCGKMGTVITNLAKSREDLTIAAGVDTKENKDNDFKIFKNMNDCTEDCDVIIDFSRPSSLDNILSFAKSKKIPVILCTTGYTEDQIDKIKAFSSENAIFRSANMSIGINVINNVLKNISSLLYNDFDIEIVEKHHNQKVDAPSGTALLLGDTIKDAIDEKTNYVYGRCGTHKREHNEIGMHSLRGGTIVGEHDVVFAGQGETIEIKHTALSREVFAVGALKAAVFMKDKKSGFYDMDNVLKMN